MKVSHYYYSVIHTSLQDSYYLYSIRAWLIPLLQYKIAITLTSILSIDLPALVLALLYALHPEGFMQQIMVYPLFLALQQPFFLLLQHLQPRTDYFHLLPLIVRALLEPLAKLSSFHAHLFPLYRVSITRGFVEVHHAHGFLELYLQGLKHRIFPILSAVGCGYDPQIPDIFIRANDHPFEDGLFDDGGLELGRDKDDFEGEVDKIVSDVLGFKNLFVFNFGLFTVELKVYDLYFITEYSCLFLGLLEKLTLTQLNILQFDPQDVLLAVLCSHDRLQIHQSLLHGLVLRFEEALYLLESKQLGHVVLILSSHHTVLPRLLFEFVLRLLQVEHFRVVIEVPLKEEILYFEHVHLRLLFDGLDRPTVLVFGDPVLWVSL